MTDGRALPRTSTVLRRELIDRLSGRFDARLTTVVGGAGVGKTTLLGQALRSDGDRVDVWVPCTPADRDSTRLLTRVAGECADVLDDYRPDDRAEPVAVVAEMVVAVAPDRVCLVFDDVHHLDDSDPFDRLLAALPANGHVLLCGRRIPAVSTARIDTLGGLLQIRQADLLLTDAELVEFARQRNVDASILSTAEGWPAFVELASRGGGPTPRDYLREEVLAALPDARRHGLAAFALVGGGDDEIARAAAGCDLDELLDGIPLVRWTGELAQLHDLWAELLDGQLDDTERRAVTSTAAGVYRRRGDFESSITLRALTDDWSAVVDDVGAAIRDGVDGGLVPRELRRWLSLLPSDLEHPVITLARGVVERDRDPTASETAALFSRAAEEFRAVDDPDMELVAVLQRGYVARLSRDPAELDPVIRRLDELAEVHRPARPFRAFGQAWAALMAFDNQAQYDALQPIVEARLPPVWAVSRDHLLANALLGLGRPDEALRYAPDVEALEVPVPGAITTRSQCQWAAGLPTEALAFSVDDDRQGARDRFLGLAWSAAMVAWTGDVDEARRIRTRIERLVGTDAPDISMVQLAGVDLLISLAEGAEDEVAAVLASIFASAPPEPSAVDQTFRSHVAVPYVVAPESRERLEQMPDAGPSIEASRRIARAFVAAREGETRDLVNLDWVDPAFIAVTLPCRLAVELGLRAVDAGQSIGGRRLIAWLCEHWGDPARAVLRSWVDDDDLGGHAAEVLAETPMPPPEPASVAMLGTMRLLVGGYASDDPDWRRERVRALLAWLVVHRTGVRDQIAGVLWPDLSLERAARNLRTTLNYLHAVLEPHRSKGDATWYLRVDGPEIRIDPSLDVDVWRFAALLADADRAERTGRIRDALPLLVEAVGVYSGDLAPDLDVEWLELERIHLRSRFIRASCRAAELLVAMRRADEAVDIAKAALGVDPYHAGSYAALASAYEELGDVSAARSVRARADERLADL